MTVFLTLGWVGIGAECVWPVLQLRLLLLLVGIEFGGRLAGYARALASAVKWRAP